MFSLLKNKKILYILFVVGQCLLLSMFYSVLSLNFFLEFFVLNIVIFFAVCNCENFLSMTVQILWVSCLALFLYGYRIESNQSYLLLKYFLSSQSSLMWMIFLIWSAAFCCFINYFLNNRFLCQVIKILYRAVIIFGFSGMLIRWYESYLILPYSGNFPLSNEFEILVWVILLTVLLFIWFDERYSLNQVGIIVFFILSFLALDIFYHNPVGLNIQPLVPALQSVWIKIHVPTSFIGYACFAFSAAVGGCILIEKKNILSLILPKRQVLSLILYRGILIGTLFFSVGIISGSLWAADAWGSYWQWDPKEVWALIVWLYYMIWLHTYAAYPRKLSVLSALAVAGFLVSLIAFRGVNLWMSSLHSYG